MRTLSPRPALCPITWPDAVRVGAGRLRAELMGYSEGPGRDPDRRAHAEAVLVDLLQPVTMTTIEVRLPAEERARQVAEALTDDPADRRTLAEWGRHVAASERTLARGFVAGTGLAFGRWRARLRLQAALPALAAGESVGNGARHVGYEWARAVAAAVRRETGPTPAASLRRPPRQAGGARASGDAPTT